MIPDLGFGDFGGRVWLNSAHQGALPRRAEEAALDALSWMRDPVLITAERFASVPERVRAAIGRLLNAPVEEVVLANSASYGLHMVANAFPWQVGDEVLVTAGDFPADILPWLAAAERHDIRIRRIVPVGHVIEPGELPAAVTSRTRLLCATWVHSFSGHVLDLDGIGTLCRERGITFVLNASQALGTVPLDTRTAPVDVVVGVGFKWLCGPYGTGVFWLRPELRDRLSRQKAYWLVTQSPEDLSGPIREVTLHAATTARDFDIFGTANFLSFNPFAAAVEAVMEVGVAAIQEHNQALVDQLLDGLPASFRVLSPRERPRRSTLVFISHKDPDRNPHVHKGLLDSGIDVALRDGALRLSPHLYNTPGDIARTLEALDACGVGPGKGR